MSITNYTELKTAVASWLNRSDMTSIIPDLITLGESRINRDLSALPGETTATVTLTSGNNYATLPAGFAEPISLNYTADEYEPQQVDMKDLDGVSTSATGKPLHYAISDKIYFPITADQTYSLTMRYRKRWDIAGDSTNTLLTQNPDIYLYCALAESGLYLKHPFLQAWRMKAQECIDSLNAKDSRVRGRSPSRVDAGLSSIGGRSYNITTDI